METRKRLKVIGIPILTVLVTLALGVGIALAQDTDLKENINGPSGSKAVALHDAIPIQGRLTDNSGNPLNGGYTIRARIYDVSVGGTALCEDTDTIAVNNGLFNMYLDGSSGCTASDIDGKQLYLGITVGSDAEMTPRQGIYPVPYAWSLRPEAIIRDTTNTVLFSVENGGAGTAIVGECDDGYGVYGSSSSWYGVSGTSVTGRGVRGATNREDNNYGLYTTDNLYSLNIHLSGAQMQIVQNGGLTSLETGDVVAFSGIGAPLEEGGPPVIKVVSANSANSTAVAGVVYSRYNIETLKARQKKVVSDVTPKGAAAPGEYLLVVVRGPAQVKASALAGPLQPGDLLSSASETGYAARATEMTFAGVRSAVPGTILGKVLEPLDEGEAMIYVFVTLH